jgi:hypothetical protein
LARRLFADRIETGPGETLDDVLAGCAAVASARASLFGRAPVAEDVELALTVFGFLGEGHDDLMAMRTSLFQSVAHDYRARRRIVDLVPERTLRRTLQEVRSRPGARDALLEGDPTGSPG